jgi:hypothetical protein
LLGGAAQCAATSSLAVRRHLSIAPRLVALAALTLALVATPPVRAWSNHALCTWPALAPLPEVARASPVAAERLEDFLAAEAVALVRVLDDEQRWARANVPTYPPRPDALAFRAEGADPVELRRRFLAALRINPESHLTLFVQLKPGEAAGGRQTLPDTQVTTLKRSDTTHANTFLALRPGDPVAVADVLAAASDEPDHGLDVGLFEDNGTAYGRQYAFGKQPFGYNPQIEFSSQGPFHLGFFHESAIVYKAAPFLLRTWPEYRIHLYTALARHALRSGHPYWGWRFAGWALHYVQDLAQPYHARVLPGVGVPTMLWINTLDLIGLHTRKENAVALVTNRHLALENYQLHRVRSAWLRHDDDDAALRALRDTRRDAESTWSDAAPRAVVTAVAAAQADALDAALEGALPPRYIADPTYVFGTTEPDVDLYRVVTRAGPAEQAAMTTMLERLLGDFGRHTRAYVRAVAGSARQP